MLKISHWLLALLPYIGSKSDIIGLVVKYQQVGHRTEILRLTICCIKHFKSFGIAVKIFFLNPQWFQSYYRHTKRWNLKWSGARARMRWMKMLAKHEREGCSKSGNGREWGSRAKDRPDFHFRRGGGGVVASAQGPRTPQCLHHALAGHGRTSGGQNATFSHCHIWLGLVLLLLWSVPSRTNF